MLSVLEVGSLRTVSFVPSETEVRFVCVVVVCVVVVDPHDVPVDPVAVAVGVINLPTVVLSCKKRRLLCTNSDTVVFSCGSSWASRDWLRRKCSASIERLEN